VPSVRLSGCALTEVSGLCDSRADESNASWERTTLGEHEPVPDGKDLMSTDDRTALLDRWRKAGNDVASHDEAQQARLRGEVGSAEAAVLGVVCSSSDEPPSPTHVLELLARRNNGVTQAAGALAIQRLVARGELRLTPDALLTLPTAT
jgi:hypothetical protein